MSTDTQSKGRKKSIENLKPYNFKPGQSGNPGGRPKRLPITEMYARMLASPAVVAMIEASLIRILRKGNMAAVFQLREIADRVEGKVSQHFELSGQLNLADAIQEARKRVAIVRIKANGPGE